MNICLTITILSCLCKHSKLSVLELFLGMVCFAGVFKLPLPAEAPLQDGQINARERGIQGRDGEEVQEGVGSELSIIKL